MRIRRCQGIASKRTLPRVALTILPCHARLVVYPGEIVQSPTWNNSHDDHDLGCSAACLQKIILSYFIIPLGDPFRVTRIFGSRDGLRYKHNSLSLYFRERHGRLFVNSSSHPPAAAFRSVSRKEKKRKEKFNKKSHFPPMYLTLPLALFSPVSVSSLLA